MEPSPHPLWDSVTAEANRLVHGPRQSLYSHPSVDYGRVCDLYEALVGITLSVPEAVCFMLCIKLSRIGNALDQEFTADMVRDSLVDLAGYADCLYAVWSDATADALDESIAELLEDD